MTALDADTSRMLADSVEAFGRAPAPDDPAAAFHAQGWLQCALPEEAGGLGFGPEAAAIIAGGLARYCRAEPLTQTYMAARLLGLVAPDSRAAHGLAEEGETVALAEGPVRAEGRALHGTLRHVPAARHVLIAVEDGLWLLAQDAGDRQAHIRVDGADLGTLLLSDAPAERLAETVALAPALRRANAETRLVAAAELLAHAEVMLELVQEHLRTRRQFGQSLGQFQALQHRAVDLYSQALLSRAVLDAALSRADTGLDDLDRAGCRAKARANDAAMAIARGAIQMFGALGITEESPLAPHVRRVLALVPWLGTSAALRHRYARLGRVLTRTAAQKETAA